MRAFSIAHLLLISSQNDYIDNFLSFFQKNDFSVKVQEPQQILDNLQSHQPDLILIDVECENFDGFTLIKAIKENAKTNHIPVVCLAENQSPALFEKALDCKVDDVFMRDLDLDELNVLIKPLLRLSTMYGELEERVALAQKEGVQQARATVSFDDKQGQKILLLQPNAGDKAVLDTLLDGQYVIEAIEDLFDGESRLEQGGFVACILSLHRENMENILAFCMRARNNPRLFNLPMIILNDGCLDHHMEAYERGVTHITERPLNLDALKTKLICLINRQKLRWSIRKAMDTTKNVPLTDPVTNGYNKAFFEQHFEGQVKRAQNWNKHLSLVFFSISNLDSIHQQFGEKAAHLLLQQIYQWISSLCRVEDMVARFDDKKFCVALPDTPMDETQIVMHRIAGILSYTDFAIEDVFQPVRVWVEVGSSTLVNATSFNQIIENAHKNID